MVNPTGYTALDMIGFTDQGAYSSSDNYVKNDLVHYSGNIWRCLIDDTTGIAPAEGVNWTLFIGEPTNLVERIIAPVETDPATNAWAVGRQIIYNDNLYEVIAAITAGDALVAYEDDPTNANIKLADPVETQLLNESAARAAADLTLQNALSHRNLLDNAWFTVNQRGQSSYTSPSSYEITVDRWHYKGTLNVVDGGVQVKRDSSVNSNLWTISELSRLEFGEQYTLSVIVDDVLYSGTITIPTPTSTNQRIEAWTSTSEALRAFGIYIDIYGWQFFINVNDVNNFHTIKAVKMEKGTVSTLAMDTVPNYAEELLKCQRYFVRLKNVTSTFGLLAIGIIHDTTYAWLAAPLPTTMRTTPTITMTKAVESAIVVAAKGDVAAQAKTVNSISGVFLSDNMVKFNAYFNSQTDYEVGAPAMLWISDSTNSSYIDLSADL